MPGWVSRLPSPLHHVFSMLDPATGLSIPRFFVIRTGVFTLFALFKYIEQPGFLNAFIKIGRSYHLNKGEK